MNTVQISNILLCDKHVAPIFGGTLALDELPDNISSFPVCYCVNTATSNCYGEHWIGIYLEKMGVVELFCSFGSTPELLSTSKHIREFLMKYGQTNIDYNSICLQNIYSSYCGFYVIFYLKIKCRGFTLSDFVNCFTKYGESNDNIVDLISKKYISH